MSCIKLTPAEPQSSRFEYKIEDTNHADKATKNITDQIGLVIRCGIQNSLFQIEIFETLPD